MLASAGRYRLLPDAFTAAPAWSHLTSRVLGRSSRPASTGPEIDPCRSRETRCATIRQLDQLWLSDRLES